MQSVPDMPVNAYALKESDIVTLSDGRRMAAPYYTGGLPGLYPETVSMNDILRIENGNRYSYKLEESALQEIRHPLMLYAIELKHAANAAKDQETQEQNAKSVDYYRERLMAEVDRQAKQMAEWLNEPAPILIMVTEP